MKNKIILSVMTLGLITWSCSESPIGQQPIDSIAPGAVSNVNVKNIGYLIHINTNVNNVDISQQ